jgi:YD repeat-containing protein
MLDHMPPDQRVSLSPDQMKELSEFFDALGKTETGTTFTYDDQGRVTHTRERNILEDKTTSILYNERGDKIRERTTFKNNSVVPIGVPSSASPERSERSRLHPDSDIRYDYQYDSYGNWTERTETRADGSSAYTRRVLTYY